MITYSKSFLGLPLLLRWAGSPVPRALPFPVLCTLVTVYLHHNDVSKDALAGILVHPYPYQVFCFVLGFSLMFRCARGAPRVRLDDWKPRG